ncbi:TetR/AcrR family transcriptional regulator [Caldifermentibacillus hisashii]
MVTEMGNSNLLNKMAEIIQKSDNQTAKQKKIMEVAISLFAEKGYSNTATAEIAKLAGVAEGTIFKHYGTKENLLLSIMVPFLKELFPSMADELFEELMTDNISFEEFLRKFLKNRTHFLLDNQEIFQVFIKEMIYKEELKNELVPYIFEQASPRLGKVIDVFQKRGEVIDLPISQIKNVLATTVFGFFISRFALLNRQYLNDEEIDHIVRFIINGIGSAPNP